MSFLASLYKGYGEKTVAANTVIVQLIEPAANFGTYVADFVYTSGNTAHTVTVMRPLNSAKVVSAIAPNTAAAVLTLTADPGVYSGTRACRVADNPIAPADYIAVELSDGTIFNDVANTNTTGASLVLTTTLPVLVGIPAGAKVWFYGITTDLNPADGQAHLKMTTTANAAKEVLWGSQSGEAEAVGIGSNSFYEPLLIVSSNGTAAGTINRVSAVYLARKSPTPSLNGI